MEVSGQLHAQAYLPPPPQKGPNYQLNRSLDVPQNNFYVLEGKKSLTFDGKRFFPSVDQDVKLGR